MEDKEKILIGEIIPVPESDVDDPSDLIDAASMHYDAQVLIDSIGTRDFIFDYYATINNLIRQPIESLLQLCRSIINKVKDKYDFEFSTNMEISDMDGVKKLLNFIKFLNFGSVEFLVSFWEKIPVDILKVNLEDTLRKINLDYEIDRTLKTYPQNEIISDYLRTNTKEGIFDFFLSNSELYKVEIYVRILEKGGKLNASDSSKEG